MFTELSKTKGMTFSKILKRKISHWKNCGDGTFIWKNVEFSLNSCCFDGIQDATAEKVWILFCPL